MTDTTHGTAPEAAAGAAAAVPDFQPLLDTLRATFRSGRTRDVEWRTRQLSGLIDLLTEHEDELIEALRADLGRPTMEGFMGDIGPTKAEIAYLRKHVASWMRPRRASLPMNAQPAKGRIVPEPLGVALVISPWNYPVQLLLEPLAAALAAGNCVVCKPSELAPASSAVLARLIPRHVDPDAVAVVEGAVPETTALLRLRWDHIFFTGSTGVGRVVMEAAAKHLTPVVLELGGKSPTIVAADADLETTARRIMWAKHFNAGQTCIAPDYVLAEASIRDRLVELMAATSREFLGDDPEASPDYTRIINDRHFTRVTGLLAGAGGTVASGGRTNDATRFIEPTIVVDPDLDAPVMQEEIFGPVLPVVSVANVDEAIDFVNERPKPLALYVFSRSGDTVDRVLAETSSGGACVNHLMFHITPPELPFGGVGPSGMGTYHGKAGFDAFTHHKSVMHRGFRPDLRFLYPPYRARNEKLVRKAL
jgi:aldehyde dehydrogenase (NAD+)